MRKIYIIGSTPPPIGGVTVHVQRLLHNLRLRGIETYIIELNNTTGFTGAIKKCLLLFRTRGNIYHIHLSNNYVKFILVFFLRAFSQRVIVTYHSLRKVNLLEKILIKLTIKLSNFIIGVGPEITANLDDLQSSKKIVTISPFLPILPSEKKPFSNTYEYKQEIILAVNAYRLILENGEDIYGIKDSIMLLNQLIPEFPDIKLKIFLGDIGDCHFYQELIELVNDLKLSKKVSFIIGENLMDYFNEIDIFLRPTTTDSYGISIAEALEFRVPSIASNVCKRPKGTILFEKKNPKDLYEKVVYVIENYDLVKMHCDSLDEGQENLIKIIDIYKKT